MTEETDTDQAATTDINSSCTSWPHWLIWLPLGYLLHSIESINHRTLFDFLLQMKTKVRLMWGIELLTGKRTQSHFLNSLLYTSVRTRERTPKVWLAENNIKLSKLSSYQLRPVKAWDLILLLLNPQNQRSLNQQLSSWWASDSFKRFKSPSENPSYYSIIWA